MKTTSHFLGISLNNNLFSDLFKSLQKYLIENNTEDVIEFQDLSSLHITLYYFGKKLNSEILAKIKSELLELNKKNNLFPISIDELNFFKQENQNHLCYLYPSKSRKIKEINSILKQNYFSEVVDNDYPEYIPHTTLFKIKNFDKYRNHHKSILKIIKNNLEKIKEYNSFQSINLFAVNSLQSPEKQRIVI